MSGPPSGAATPAAALARRWIEQAAAPAGLPAGDDAALLELGWALKQQGYEAMYADPALGERLVAALGELAGRANSAKARAELDAIAAWLGGAGHALRGRAGDAVALLDQAHDALLALDRPHDAAASQVPKLIALAMLGRHDEALACGERTLAQLAAAGDDALAGRVEINLGTMLLRRHCYPEAAQRYRAAAVRFARVRDHRHSVMADIGLAGALSWSEQCDEAERIYERAESRLRSHGLADLQPVVDSNRGLLALRRGRHASALSRLAAALSALERGAAPQRLADARRDLADAYLSLNLLPEAVALYDQAIAACRQHPAQIEEAWATMQRALACQRLGRLAEAREGLVRARALFEANRNAVGAARAAAHRAALALASGGADIALADATAAANDLAAADMPAWQAEARLLAAQALAALGRRSEAAAAFAAVSALPAATPEVVARCHEGRGHIQMSLGAAAAAREAFEAAAACIENQRARLPGDEFRTAYGIDKPSAFDALVEIEIDAGDAAACARLLAAMERARSRSLALGIAEGGAREAVDPEAGERRSQLHWLDRQAERAAAMGHPQRAAEFAGQRRAVEAAMLQAHRRAQARGAVPGPTGRGVAGTALPPLASRPAGVRPAAEVGEAGEARAAEVREAAEAREPAEAREAAEARVGPTLLDRARRSLAADEALVVYHRLGRRLAVLIARAAQVERLSLPAGDIDEAIEQLRFQVDALRFGSRALLAHAAQLRRRAQAHLRRLHRQLWAPLEGLLTDARRITIAPHGMLHYVPFAALCGSDEGDAALLERHAIGLTPTIQSWLDEREARAAAAGPAVPARVLAVGVGGASLPHVEHELQAVSAAFANATRLAGDQATLAALRQGLAGVDVLHLACHGRFRADSPYFSALHLADGPLTLRDAMALPLAGIAVTLSACETGMSKIAPGDELLGLLRGVLLAGAPTVLATLWTVDDEATARLMRRYYRGLCAGLPAAEALRAAQLELRAEFPHPYHWAPFVLHGRA